MLESKSRGGGFYDLGVSNFGSSISGLFGSFVEEARILICGDIKIGNGEILYLEIICPNHGGAGGSGGLGGGLGGGAGGGLGGGAGGGLGGGVGAEGGGGGNCGCLGDGAGGVIMEFHFVLIFASSLSLSKSNQGIEHSISRNLKEDQPQIPEVNYSRERSRAAWKVIEEYLMPFLE
ncbi:unnamed protein product [Fraxinus pennsylvanica]|uniref:Uncharacterized protein n=1 Tax=Fraxinus pennsylvanica TaxID=56036 RepID=A0AAD2ABR4_9LAMI|nr:unnamed protein product [Fraxinus pennsylvanica]